MVKKKEYSNGEITVVWQPRKCIHSGKCFEGLPSVFQPRVRPWIKIEAASTENIVNQVKACPSGALSYYRNDDAFGLEDTLFPTETLVEIVQNGPLRVHGNIKVVHQDGIEEVKHARTLFCRCGGSSNKPFCDGTHNRNGFEG